LRKEIYRIWADDPRVTLTLFLDGEKRGAKSAVIVLPGGGYVANADGEADPIALHFAQMGYAAFVLRYSTLYDGFEVTDCEENPHTKFPEPMLEVGAAISFVRDCSSELGIDPGKITLMGFSAGGHLAANYANKWNTEAIGKPLGIPAKKLKPNGSVLCYAATSLLSLGDSRMPEAVFGTDSVREEGLKSYSAQFGVNADTPPTFLWHAKDDDDVPVQQTIDMAKALADKGIAYEMHLFETGGHATALSVGLPAEAWKDMADRFLLKNIK